MLLPGRSSVDLRAALGRHPGMVPGHPSRSVMTRHPHTAGSRSAERAPGAGRRAAQTSLPGGRPPGRRAWLWAWPGPGAPRAHPQAAAQGHILLTSQPRTRLSLPSSSGPHPSGRPSVTPPASGAHGPARPHLAGGLLPSSRPFLSLCPASGVPTAPQGGTGYSHPACLQLQALGRLCPPPSTRSLHLLHGQPCPQPSGLFCGMPSSPSSGTSLTPLPPTCPPPARRPLVLCAGWVMSRGTAGGACCPCHRGSRPGQPGLTLCVCSEQPQSFPRREGRSCKEPQMT